MSEHESHDQILIASDKKYRCSFPGDVNIFVRFHNFRFVPKILTCAYKLNFVATISIQ